MREFRTSHLQNPGRRLRCQRSSRNGLSETITAPFRTAPDEAQIGSQHYTTIEEVA